MADVARKLVGGTWFTYLESGQKAFEARNYVDAFRDFKQAAADGGETLPHCAEAYRMLGQYYQFGYDGIVPKDLEKAKKHYGLAFGSGDQNAGMLLRGLDPAMYERVRQEYPRGAQPAILRYREMQRQQQMQQQQQYEAQERARQEMAHQQRQQGERDFRPDTW